MTQLVCESARAILSCARGGHPLPVSASDDEHWDATVPLASTASMPPADQVKDPGAHGRRMSQMLSQLTEMEKRDHEINGRDVHTPAVCAEPGPLTYVF